MPGKQAHVKNEKQYEALKDKGMSKERAAKIANSPGSSSRGGKASHSSSSRSPAREAKLVVASRRRSTEAEAAEPPRSTICRSGARGQLGHADQPLGEVEPVGVGGAPPALRLVGGDVEPQALDDAVRVAVALRAQPVADLVPGPPPPPRDRAMRPALRRRAPPLRRGARS